MDSLFMVMPAYNEAENIMNTIEQWHTVLKKINCKEDSRLVVIDDGSKDDTFNIAKGLEKKYPLLKVITKENGGHGSAVLYGYRYAIKHETDFIFQTDSDGQTNPDEFYRFWKLRNQYDAILGNRVQRGDGKSRAYIEKVVCLLLRLYFHINVPDANAPFRLMKKELVQKYIGRMPKNYPLPNIMFTTFFARYKERIKFIEISFRPRQAGVNSVNYKRVVQIGWNALHDFHKFKQAM